MPERVVTLVADDGVLLGDPEQLLGPDVLAGPPVEHRIDDTYYDTEDLRLLRWGCAVRHRKRQGWTVVLPTLSRDRGPVEREVSFRGRAGQLPDEVAAIVASLARGERLAPVATVVIERQRRSLKSADGAMMGELVDDRAVCTVAASGGSTTTRRLALEPSPSVVPILIERLVDRLIEAGARPESGELEIARALEGRRSIGPDVIVPKLGREPSGRDVVRRAIARSTVRLITELPGAVAGVDPRGVHRARVAIRRLRSDLRTFRPLLDRAWADAVRAELRLLARSLGGVRDADVFLAWLRSAVENHPEIASDALAPVLAVFELEREEARVALGRQLGEGSIDGLLEWLVIAAADPPTTRRADRPAGRQLARLVARPYRRLVAAVDALGSEPSDAELHRVRLLIKRTRYAATAVAPVLGSDARALAASLAESQDALGDRLDAAIAERRLSDAVMSLADEIGAETAFAAGRLAELLRQQRTVDPWRWHDPYRRASRKRRRAWLGSD